MKNITIIKKSVNATLLLALCLPWQNCSTPVSRIGLINRPAVAVKKFSKKQHQSRLARPYNAEIIAYNDHLSHLVHRSEFELDNIPGIENLMKTINAHKQNTQVKGFWFELEIALDIQHKYRTKKSNEKLVAIHYKLQGPQAECREIDIVTNKRCIECKNVRWEIMTDEDKNKIFIQILDQKKLIDWHNQNQIPIKKNYNIRCTLWSAHKIPEDVKIFLRQHKIDFVEGLESSLYTTKKISTRKEKIINTLATIGTKILSPLLSRA